MNKNTVNREINKTIDKVIDVPCNECDRVNKHRILASVSVDGEDWYGENSVQYWDEYQIILCQGCETTSFRISSTNSEDWDFVDADKVVYNKTINLYPSRDVGRNPIKDSHLLPSNVQRIYEESIKAMNNEQPVLAGIGIRALVETICKDKQAEGYGLDKKIDNLVTKGVLTAEGATILHKIRTLGNNAAHEVKPHTADQLGLALDVCEHLLQGVYLLPHFASKTFPQ
jgi:Domain of unknown function (DUF4145)